ncbi:MAG TPA: hypothetical protein VIK39_19135 [Candidatus Angelobacter sp.]
MKPDESLSPSLFTIRWHFVARRTDLDSVQKTRTKEPRPSTFSLRRHAVLLRHITPTKTICFAWKRGIKEDLPIRIPATICVI